MTSNPPRIELRDAGPSDDPLVPSLHLKLDATFHGEPGFDVWREKMSGLFEILPPAEGFTESFRIENTSWHLGELVVTDFAFSAREQARTPRKIRADQIDHYRVLLQTSGTLRVEVDDRQVVVAQGQALISDMARPERLSTTAGSNIVLIIPREVLDEALPAPMSLHGLVLEGPAARLLSSFLPALVSEAGTLRRSSATSISRSSIQLVSAALAPSLRTMEAARPAIEVNLMRQVCRYIDLHLTDAELSPIALCKVFRVSRPSLYRMFEPMGGVAAYIRERRLTKIHGLLESSSAARLRLGRLAEEYTFTDAGHFSKSFRKMFGYSPSEVTSAAPSVALDSAMTTANQGRGINGWLLGLSR